MAEIRAKLRFLRKAPRKVRLVLNLIRGENVKQAKKELQFLNKSAREPVRKLLLSAVANAKHNFGVKEDDMFIKEIRVDEGPILKRRLPRAMGRSTMIRKKTSHITIVLSEQPNAKLKNPNPRMVRLGRKKST